ncbi:glycosyltransferase [Paracoccus jeotgali]|uniref:Glycosyl transferase n=1 Tax=Paracoccus jeotgali TaxID=2065379 RepID=A0A2K9MJ90_9RHOB|nr:glycosyltransferase [Paracoccus jeotgali]AUM75096.1 glycosyl transferase [Paracoccus jeotgali]
MTDLPGAAALTDAAIFDAEFYAAQLPQRPDDPLAHFLTEGDRSGLDPSPYFSTSDYKQRYPDWQESGAATAVEDMLTRIGRGEMRQPHPMIDPEFYLSTHPDLSGLGAEAALHFIRHGDAEGRRPSVLFDPRFYARRYLLTGETHAFRHFATVGRAQGFLPRPVPRTTEESRARMEALLSPLTRPMLFVAHDAQPAGVPILTLDLARHAMQRGFQPVFLLDRGGPLSQRFVAMAPTVILVEGWDLDGLVQALPPELPALVNSAAAAPLAVRLAPRCRSLVLIHEMPAYLHAQNLIAPLQQARDAGAELVASFDAMAAGLQAELGPMQVIQPGIMLPPLDLASARRTRRLIGRPKALFIGAGHADHRKGFDLFLQAAQALQQELPGARFVWLGNLDQWAGELAREAIAAGLDLHLPGFVEDYTSWYRLADAYLLTSRQDPGPATAVHAAAMGAKVVAYDHDIALKDRIPPHGEIVAAGDLAGYVKACLAGVDEPATRRRARRRYVRAHSDMGGYFSRLADALTRAQAN